MPAGRFSPALPVRPSSDLARRWQIGNEGSLHPSYGHILPVRAQAEFGLVIVSDVGLKSNGQPWLHRLNLLAIDQNFRVEASAYRKENYETS